MQIAKYSVAQRTLEVHNGNWIELQTILSNCFSGTGQQPRSDTTSKRKVFPPVEPNPRQWFSLDGEHIQVQAACATAVVA